MKAKIKMLICLLFIFLGVGCKKQELVKENPYQQNTVSEKARAWLEAQTGTQNLQKVLLDQKLVDIHPKLLWDKTNYYAAEKITITPVDIVSVKSDLPMYRYFVTEMDDAGKVTAGNYYAVLNDKKGQGSFTNANVDPGLLSSKKIPADFSGAIIKYGLDHNVISAKHYEKGVLTNKTDKIAVKKSKNQVPVENVEQLPENCDYVTIEWWWQVYVNGVLVYEEYVGNTVVVICDEGNGGGGGGPGPMEVCNQQFNNLINNSGPASAYIGKTLISETQAERTYNYKWKCHTSSGGWYVRSIDVGTHEKDPVTQQWKWKSIVHSTIDVIGTTLGGTVEKTGPGTGTVILMGNINASYKLDYALKYTASCLGITFFSFTKEYTASTIFSLNPYPGGPEPSFNEHL